MIVKGTCIAKRKKKDGLFFVIYPLNSSGSDDTLVYTFHEGDYFGEISLVRNIPR